MFGAGRLAMIRSQPRRAIEYYTKATEIQSQYRNLHHISFWEIAIANFALYDTHASLESWRQLEAEATVSESGMCLCIYTSFSTVVQSHILIRHGDLLVGAWQFR
jgi:hypothetical protein